MWRKGILLQCLVSSVLLAGAAEARQAGASGDLVLGRAVAERTGIPSLGQEGLGKGRGKGVLAGFRSGLGGDGDVGSHIDPDGGRLRATVDPHG